MRSDRYKKEKEKQTAKKNKGFRVLSIIYSILVICFIASLLWLNVLPAEYLYPLIGVIVVISLFIVPVMYSKNGKKNRKKIAAFFAVLFMVLFGIGTYYMTATIGFFNAITSIGGTSEDFYLVVKADSSYDEASQLSGKTVATYATADTSYAEAKTKLQDEVSVEYSYIESIPDLLDGLLDEDYPAIFISAATYDTMKESDSQLETETKIIHTISVKVQSSRTTKHVDVTDESFNILVSGLDTTGDISTVSRSDVNMVVTINPVTKQILLTSIPRDYYVDLPSKGAKDKLTHSGLYGIDETVGAVEQALGIEINYYVKVNYSTVVKLVDAIGGIDIYSPYTFTTHGMTDHYTFYEGENHLDGSMALAYSRERQSFSAGDMQRNENQQLILKAIMDKALQSSTILSDYTSILSAIEDNLETDMGSRDIRALIRMQLGDMASWDIQTQALKGEPDFQICYALGTGASVVMPDAALIAEAADKIMQISGETTQ